MKRNLLFLFALGTLLTLGTATSNLMAQGAQGGAAPANPHVNPPAAASNAAPIPVLLVDIMYLMQVHPKFHAEKNALIQNQKAARDQLQLDMQKLQNMSRELQALQPGTPAYSNKLDELRRFEFELNNRAAKLSDEAQLRQLSSSYIAYQEIKNCVNVFARQNNVVVVINYLDVVRHMPTEQLPSPEQLPPPEAMEAEMSLMQSVVWRNAGYDITSKIEGMINQTYAGKYPPVDYEQVKAQMFGKSPVGASQPPTNIATGTGMTGRQ